MAKNDTYWTCRECPLKVYNLDAALDHHEDTDHDMDEVTPKPATPQVAALPGMTPLGLTDDSDVSCCPGESCNEEDPCCFHVGRGRCARS